MVQETRRGKMKRIKILKNVSKNQEKKNSDE